MKRTAFLASLVLLVGPAPALADTMLGQLADSTHASCRANHVYLQAESAASLPSYAVPAPGGVISSWSEIPLGGEGYERLLLAKQTSLGGYTLSALSPEEHVSGADIQTFPVRIPAASGEVLGLDVLSGTSLICEFPGINGDLVQAFAAAAAQSGATLLPELGGAEREQRLNVTATLEPDADHDGYGDTSQDLCPTDPSTHEACPPPQLSGVAQVGQTLQASVAGQPENPAYSWLRCGVNGEACYPIQSSKPLLYTITSLDIGHTLRFRATAHNAQDTQTTESAPTAVVPFGLLAARAPRLEWVDQSARRWREGNGLPRYTTLSRPSRGTVFRFAVSRPTTVHFTFTEQVLGRVLAGKCTAPNRHNAHRRRCVRRVGAGTLSVSARRGINRLLFQGRISPVQKLASGSYTALISAGPPAASSPATSLGFTILPR